MPTTRAPRRSPPNATPRILNRPHSIHAGVTSQTAAPRAYSSPRVGGRRLLILRAGQPAALRLQLRRPEVLPGRLRRQGPKRQPHPELRVRAHRRTRAALGQRGAWNRQVIHRRRTRRPTRAPGDHSAAIGASRRRLGGPGRRSPVPRSTARHSHSPASSAASSMTSPVNR